jgi:hypothetical protein
MTQIHRHRTRALLALAAAGTAALLLAAFLGCGGPPGGKGQEAEPGDTIYVEGKISLRGSRPFPLLLLEAKDGVIYMIDTSPKAEELRNLDQMAVGVTAKVLPGVKGDAPALSVVAYDLLPLPSGERPIVGVIVAASLDQVVMQADDGSAWVIEGSFRTVFLDLAGSKVWIVGDRRSANSMVDGDVRSINVSEYGVIRGSQTGLQIR